VLFDDELTAEGDHKEDAEPSSEERQSEDTCVFEIEAKKNKVQAE